MTDLQFSQRPSLGDFRLRLDPEIEAQFRNLQTAPPSTTLRNLFLQPGWAGLQQSSLDHLLATPPPSSASQPLVPRGAGPSVPRAAEVGDLMLAIWAIPAVQQLGTRLLDLISDRARHDWQGLSGGERAAVVSGSALIGAGALAGVLGNKQARTDVFTLVVNKDLPVPGLAGLTVRLLPHGAGATYRNIGESGVTLSTSGQMGPSGKAEYEVMLTMDLSRYLRNL